MNRLKLLATATLVALAFTACDEGTPPPVEPPPPPTPVGTISGSVTIEGTAAAGITATLSSGATTTTGSGGNFAFSGVEAGTYTVTISGFPEDATFAQVTQSATIATDGQNVQLNFAGEYVRSSAVVGSVVAADAMMSGGDGQPETLAGVTVTLDGEHAMGETMETGMDGGFAFTGLRAGTYTVTISDFPEDVSFETVSVEVEVEVGEVGQADFTGHYIRTSAVEGEVIIDGEGLPGVLVTLVGGPSDENFTMTTDADGMYRFEDLRPGDYTVSISDFDTRDYEFAATSQDVSVDLDETGTVSFTGVLLRTSGISGRVSVEGMGLGDIAVTLSGAADASTMTDAGGQYAFSGLAAGDYTVSIAVASAAYVFDSMSQDRTVGDDESAIVNFDGQHARTASVSGMLFLDELDKNDEYDAGEHPLASAGIPVALVGPGVNEQRIGASDATGAFSFAGLRAGAYQLVFLNDAATAAALAASHVAYGGPGTGYSFDLGVGEAASQSIPFDITHTTVSFSVSLRSGDAMGDALSGASVTLYGANDARVGTGTTGEDGSVAIVVARAGTSGNMVMAGVSADGYHVADGKTAVSWDPQMFATSGANSNDIVNLNVSATVSGATVARGDHGGDALAGWAISVTSGGAAVAGAPTELGADGTASLATTVGAGDLPASFTFAVAADQDDALDYGEMYEGSGGGYEHDGLSVAAGDADPIVVTYTTQTLKVFVHEEKDQVRGYTGNVLGGDQRMSGLVDLEVRQASGNDGRFTSPISSDDWDSRANSSDSKGVYTFAHLPADKDIVVRATARDGYKILDLVQLDAYRNMDENGVEGGAFGAMGGWGPTVALCPLEEIEPTGQDFGDCASFGLVELHTVTADVSKMTVAKSGTVFGSPKESTQSGVEVSLTPVEGKNLAGVGASFTTAKSNDPTTTADDRRAHSFDDMAAGSYTLGLSDGWVAMAGTATGQSALDPLGGDVALTVRPTTTTVYGFVRDQAGFGLKDLSVEVNGQTVETDNLGRYMATGVASASGKKINVSIARTGYPTTKKDTAFVANTPTQVDITLSGANNTVAITGRVTDSGTGEGIKGVEILVDGKAPLNSPASRTGDDGNYSAIVKVQPNNDPLVEVTPKKSGYHFIPAKQNAAAIVGGNPTANFTGYRATEIVGNVTGPGGGMPKAEVTVTAYSDAAMTKAIAGAKVTTTETGTFSIFVPTLSGTVYLGAKPRSDYDPTHSNYLNLRDAERYDWYDVPANRAGGAIAVIPGQILEFGTFTGNSVKPRITSVRRSNVKTDVEAAGFVAVPAVSDRGFSLVKGEPGDSIVVTWHYETRNTTGNDADGNPLPYTATGATDNGDLRTARSRFTSFATPSGGITHGAAAVRGSRTSANAAGTAGRGTVSNGTTVGHDRITTYVIPEDDDHDYREIAVRIGHAVVGAVGAAGGISYTNTQAVSNEPRLPAVPSTVTGLKANRKVTVVPGGQDTHILSATWFVPGSPQLEQRIALEVLVENPGGPTGTKWEWVVFADDPAQPAITRDTNPDTDSGANWGRWGSANFDINLSGNAGSGDAWRDDDDSDLSYTVVVKNLRNARSFRIDTRVDNGGKWAKGMVVAIPGG